MVAFSPPHAGLNSNFSKKTQTQKILILLEIVLSIVYGPVVVVVVAVPFADASNMLVAGDNNLKHHASLCPHLLPGTMFSFCCALAVVVALLQA